MSQAMEKQTLYGGKIVIERDQYHRYVITKNDFKGGFTGIVPSSVTTVLKVLNKTGLMYWSANMAVDHLRDAYTLKKELSEIDFEAARIAHTTYATAAKKTGGNVHDAVNDFIKAQIYKTKWERPVLSDVEHRTFEAFQRWVIQNKVEFLSTERIVYNSELNLAGTLDLTYRKKEQPELGIITSDIKTTDLTKYRGRLFLEWVVQVDSYCGAKQCELFMCNDPAFKTYNPTRSILKLDKVKGDFEEQFITTHYTEGTAVMLGLLIVHNSLLYQQQQEEGRRFRK